MRGRSRCYNIDRRQATPPSEQPISRANLYMPARGCQIICNCPPPLTVCTSCTQEQAIHRSGSRYPHTLCHN